jgi:hypothetical protein
MACREALLVQSDGLGLRIGLRRLTRSPVLLGLPLGITAAWSTLAFVAAGRRPAIHPWLHVLLAVGLGALVLLSDGAPRAALAGVAGVGSVWLALAAYPRLALTGRATTSPSA